MKPARTEEQQRQAEIARISILAKEAGMSEIEMKEAMMDVTDCFSRAQLNAAQRKKFIAFLKPLARAAKGEDKQLGLLIHIWQELHALGHTRSDNRAALEAWARKQFPKLAKLEWASAREMNALIERAKQWRDRPLSTTYKTPEHRV